MYQHTQNSLSSHRVSRMGVKEWTAIVLLAFGIILAFVALLIPPPGEIHDSVLYIFAQILIYCGSIFGIESYIKTLLTSRRGRDKENDKPATDYDEREKE